MWSEHPVPFFREPNKNAVLTEPLFVRQHYGEWSGLEWIFRSWFFLILDSWRDKRYNFVYSHVVQHLKKIVMGLDSVELLMSFEDKFGVSIPDGEAEKITTVQQMADSIFEKIKLKPNNKCLSQIVFYRIRKAFEEFGNAKIEITPKTKMSDLLSKTDLENDWEILETKIGLKIPKLVDLDLDKTLNKEVRFLGFKIFDRTEPVAENTLRKFTDWIISMNTDELIKIENISSKYEIERIICGIIEEKIGVPLSEIELHHSFTKNLGID